MHHLHTVFIVSSSLTVTTIINNAMLTSQYTDDWRLLSQLTTTFPYSQEEVYTALQNEEYQGNDGRKWCYELKSPILQSIYKTVVDRVPTLLEEISKFPNFVEHWGLADINDLVKNVKTTCHFVCDKPGYTTGVHLDCKSQVCTGMLFFNKEDDLKQSTTFYTSPNKDNPIRISSEYGNGWFSANTYWGHHIGGNNSSRDRYALIFISNLNLTY